MKIIIKGTNLELNQAITDYIEKKISGLQSYFKGIDTTIINVRVEIEKTTDHHRKGNIFRAEVNFEMPGKLLRAESSKEDIFMAITNVKDKLRKEISIYKTKALTNYKKGARTLKERSS